MCLPLMIDRLMNAFTLPDSIKRKRASVKSDTSIIQLRRKLSKASFACKEVRMKSEKQ